MKIEDIKDYWEVSPAENLKEGCELKCPECGEWAVHTEWIDSAVYCELCDSHDAIECPHCSEGFDHVCSVIFMCRNV